MTNNVRVLRGVIRGRIIELEQEAGVPDGTEVFVSVAPATLSAAERDELAAEVESEQALQTIHQMRHTARSVRELRAFCGS